MDFKKYLNNIGSKNKSQEESQETERKNYFNLDQEEETQDKAAKKPKKKAKPAKAGSIAEEPVNRRRKRMSKKEKRMRIAINWTLFAVAVILIVFIVIKLITGAIHLITGSGSDEEKKEIEAPAAAEATTEYVEEEKKSTGPVEIKISAIGDCVLGTDETFGYEGGFTERYDKEGNPAFFLEKVKPVLQEDDLTIANLEVALTKSLNMSDHEYNFKGEPEYARILSEGSVEAANLANSHTHDYGEDGYSDTIEFTEQAGVKTFGNEQTAIIGIKGVKVGLFGINVEEDDVDSYITQIESDISNLRLEGAQIVIASFHWGIEQESETTQTQRRLGHAAIDAGADLVLGHHPHVLQGIEEYKGKNIVYSLGNFVYGASSSPSDYRTMIYQQTFTVTGDEVAQDLVTDIIPCRISSEDDFNNYQPMILEDDRATDIQQHIEELSQEIANIVANEAAESGEGSESQESEEGESESEGESEEQSESENSDEGSNEESEENYE